jgi:hypothetical protein
MYIDIEPNDNLDEPVMATFNVTGPGQRIDAVHLDLGDGAWHWCAVTGWKDGPVAAQYTPIEESGDGPARLVTGSDHGIRLARIAAPDQAGRVVWSLTDATQWAEPFLICIPDTKVHSLTVHPA